MLERGAAERPRRLKMVGAAAMAPDVRRVIGADNGLDPGPGEGLALDQLLEIGDRGQHDVDDILLDDRLDRIQELRARPETRLARRRGPNRVQPRAHIRILGVGDDEIRTLVGARANPRQLVVEPSQYNTPMGKGSAGLIAREATSAP